ncbi:MAG TPA: 50S ribosomal protein L3 [Actinomycetota bacterium]|nr:50S ribosomal protein L3 [Actinomycetota bacterium]
MKGILGEKLGMTQIFTEDQRAVPVTVIKAGPCFVAQVKTTERDGYQAVQLALGAVPERKARRPETGHAKAAGLDATPKYLVELRVDDVSGYKPGQEIRADVFRPGERADVVGVSKGKGFSGVMKRHGFAGLSASHGTERKHRSPGAVGACATPSRIFKGTRMAGQMGNVRVSVLNLEVIEVDPERGLLLLRGAVPGPTGGLVMVKSSSRAPAEEPAAAAAGEAS